MPCGTQLTRWLDFVQDNADYVEHDGEVQERRAGISPDWVDLPANSHSGPYQRQDEQCDRPQVAHGRRRGIIPQAERVRPPQARVQRYIQRRDEEQHREHNERDERRGCSVPDISWKSNTRKRLTRPPAWRRGRCRVRSRTVQRRRRCAPRRVQPALWCPA